MTLSIPWKIDAANCAGVHFRPANMANNGKKNTVALSITELQKKGGNE